MRNVRIEPWPPTLLTCYLTTYTIPTLPEFLRQSFSTYPPQNLSPTLPNPVLTSSTQWTDLIWIVLWMKFRSFKYCSRAIQGKHGFLQSQSWQIATDRDRSWQIVTNRDRLFLICKILATVTRTIWSLCMTSIDICHRSQTDGAYA